MSRFWNDRTTGLKPYIPGEQADTREWVKLNTNEHSLPPSPAAVALLSEVDPHSLRRYPDPTMGRLGAAIAAQEGLTPAHVHCGNGSDEVLAMVFMAFFSSGTTVTVPDITYSFYPVWAELAGVTLETSPLNADFTLDVRALAAASGPLLFANPNAPTGLAIGRDDIAALAAADRDRLIVVDEAYFGFGADSAAPLVSDFDNLLVTRTLSKSHALAGMRIGYALAHPSLIEGLTRIKDSFNSYPLDSLAQRVGEAAVSDSAWFSAASASVISAREELVASLNALSFTVLPSKANFVFAAHDQLSGRRLFAALKERRILVRRWDRPRIDNWLRITVGSADENASLHTALRDIIDGS